MPYRVRPVVPIWLIHIHESAMSSGALPREPALSLRAPLVGELELPFLDHLRPVLEHLRRAPGPVYLHACPGYRWISGITVRYPVAANGLDG